MQPSDLLAVVLARAPAPGAGPRLAAMTGGADAEAGPLVDEADVVLRLAAERARAGARLAWWSAREVVPALLDRGLEIDRSWDVAEVHRLLHGGWTADPSAAWCWARGLDPASVPRPTGDDLFDFAEADGDSGDDPGDGAGDDSPIRRDGHLRADAVSGAWQDRPARWAAWAAVLWQTAQAQWAALEDDPRRRHTAWSESAAAVLSVELEHHGLPVDRPAAESLIAAVAGPRPRDEGHARRIRAARDAQVLRHVPGRETTDLRSNDQVRALLAAVGIDVPDTRKHRLAAYRDVHPLVAALLTWRAGERIATTYGYHWLDTHVGPDGRLRGAWTACDGAAGRMTAQNGLHNLPAALRPAVRAEPGHVLVRADLGQVEPRVLAAISGDRAFAAATRSPDLYLPVAQALGLDRHAAKIAVLAAMYGQTSGPAGEALRRLTRAYPTAVAYLDRAYAAGESGRPIRTYGGRLVSAGPVTGDDRRRRAAKGRFLRNASVQGSAAELFKAWAATVRPAIRPHGARIVLCLHDELLVHAPAEHAEAVARAVDDALLSASATWTGSRDVTFVADTSIVSTWAEAKA